MPPLLFQDDGLTHLAVVSDTSKNCKRGPPNRQIAVLRGVPSKAPRQRAGVNEKPMYKALLKFPMTKGRELMSDLLPRGVGHS
jgi:hypothetical protein